MKLAPTNDDLYFWFMGILQGFQCNVVENNYSALYYVEGTQNESLSSVNDYGEKKFWQQFKALLKFYPEVGEKFKLEVRK